MKTGLRKPSLNKSIAARTKGKWTRQLKRSVNPYYGKKGTGWLHPKRKAYNWAYKKTTFSIWDLIKAFLK